MARGNTQCRSSLFNCACVVSMASGVSRFRYPQGAYSPCDGKGYLPSEPGARHTASVANSRRLLYRDASAHGAIHGQETDNGRQNRHHLVPSLPPAIWFLVPVGLGDRRIRWVARILGGLSLARGSCPDGWSTRERPLKERSGVFDASSGHMTRHPRMGAAQQVWLLYRNHHEITSLRNFRRSRVPRGSYTGTC